MSEISNAQVNDAHDIGLVIPMYNLIEYSDIYLKTSGSLWQYYRDEPALDINDVITHFPANNYNEKKKFKLKKKKK